MSNSRIDIKGETLLVSKEINHGDLDMSSIVETTEEYADRVNKKLPEARKTALKKRNSVDKIIKHLPVMKLILQESYIEKDEFPDVGNEDMWKRVYEAYDLKIEVVEREVHIAIQTEITTDTMLWLMSVMEQVGNIKMICEFSNGSSTKSFKYMNLRGVHMIKSEYGLATCNLKFLRW